MDLNKQIELIKRGTVDFINEAELKKKLQKGASLKIKWGADPSAPDLHLGHMVVLKKLRTFQELGHKVIFIIGDLTGMIGDPSGKSETRKPLSREEVLHNAKSYQEQVFKVLDRKKTEVVFNSKWLSKMDLMSVMKLMSQYTVARMLERGDFKERFKENREISVVEFLYPLMQGYDSVVIDADIEVGGHDQIFNLLVGRELQKAYGKEQQVVLTMPLLEGTDGKMKMSKSLGNYIGFTESPKDIFGKTMSIPDNLMIKYYELLTDTTDQEISEIKKGLGSGGLHPKDVKTKLAKFLVEYFYGKEKAQQSEQEFDSVFKQNKLPSDMPAIKIDGSEMKDGKIQLTRLLVLSGLLPSTGEAKRMIKGGGVKINEVKAEDENMAIALDKETVLSVGKRKHARIICA
ncbi:MAG: tyrosine--tRNA ligase [Candidatus Saganbacteria bacterium]|nr:tyrosine--tRNA ligase [Candidatus Saganbacteria bacterium]